MKKKDEGGQFGTPVIAFGRGGALETVVEGETGLFFHEQTVESLCAALEEFEGRKWDLTQCRANAARFSLHKFENGIQGILSSLGFRSHIFDIIRG